MAKLNLAHKCTSEDHTDVMHSFDFKCLGAILLKSNILTVLTNKQTNILAHENLHLRRHLYTQHN